MLMQTVRVAQRLDHHDFNGAPCSREILGVDDADKCVALRNYEGKGVDAALFGNGVNLIDTCDVLQNGLSVEEKSQHKEFDRLSCAVRQSPGFSRVKELLFSRHSRNLRGTHQPD
jgi:hypothetical protein